MLTACGCVADKEQTQILAPCELHAAWAKTYAAQTWGDWDAEHPTRRPRPDRPLPTDSTR